MYLRGTGGLAAIAAARAADRRDQPRQPAAHLRRAALSSGVPRSGSGTAVLAAQLPPAAESLPAGNDECVGPLGGADRPGAAPAFQLPGDAARRSRAGVVAGGSPARR